MMLVAAIGPSNESHAGVLELAARVIELEQIELGAHDRAADLGPAILRGRDEERRPAALLERLAELLHAVDALEHLHEVAPGIGPERVAAARRADRHGHRADLALLARELALGAHPEDAAAAEHQQPIAGLADLGQ